MASKRDRDIKPSDDERVMERLLTAAFANPQDRHNVEEFCEMMRLRGDAGYDVGAAEFLASVAGIEVERVERSRMLTRMALYNIEQIVGASEEIRESSVAHFARFLAPLSKVAPSIVLRWLEDVGDGDPDEHCVPRHEVQPTAFIRGVLFSRSMPHQERGTFWSAAVASLRFPMRVFSDPCMWCEGVILSTYHQRVIADICGVVTHEALLGICAHIRERATLRAVRNQVGTRLEGGHETPVWQVGLIDATNEERVQLWQALIDSVTDTARRPLMREFFGLAGSSA